MIAGLDSDVCSCAVYGCVCVSICVQTWAIMYTSRCLFVHLDHYASLLLMGHGLHPGVRVSACVRVFVRKCLSKGACIKVRVCVPAAALQPAAAGAGPGAAGGREPAAGGSAASVAA